MRLPSRSLIFRKKQKNKNKKTPYLSWKCMGHCLERLQVSNHCTTQYTHLSDHSSSSSALFFSFFFCISCYISGVHHFRWDFCLCDRLNLTQPLRYSHFVFMDGACWVCFCCQHSPVCGMNVRIFGVHAMECMCAQTRSQFILSSERVLGGWSQNPC